MKYLSGLLFMGIIGSIVTSANAAGTYYNGNYRSPQTNYANQPYSTQRSGNYYQNQNARYNTQNYYSNNTGRQVVGTNQYTTTRPVQNTRTSDNVTTQQSSTRNGFWIDGGLSRETAMWQIDMKTAGSILRYNDVNWMALDIHGGYVFDMGKNALQIDAGLKYGFQTGDGNMIDDDITNGGATGVELETADGTLLVTQVQRVLSTGTSNGGNMLGFHAGLGLRDFIKWGNVKITPSIGYRYLKYKLETSKNFGISIDTAGCFTGPSGEIECEPAILVYQTNNGKYDGAITKQYLVTYASGNGYEIASGSQFLNPLNTYYAEQPDVSHSYEVTWSGPYVAADIEYIINANNFVNGRVELGLPGYNSVGDQPYRYDWAHPKSVEDSAGLGSGFHFGLGANYVTALTDKVSLSLGVTYDYYNVSGADAKTYLNKEYYTDRYNAILKAYEDNNLTESDMLDPDGPNASAEAINIKALESECSGWACTLGGEIDSFYKSLGIRVGINAKF